MTQPNVASPAHFPLCAAGGQERRAKTSEALKRLAKRILTFPEGNHEPSPPPQLLEKLTDEILVIAADAVKAVVEQHQPQPSGKAQYRLLAWTVADARGATALLDKPLAETVGKRLDRQAQKVFADLQTVRLGMRDDRLRVTRDAELNPDLRSTLRRDLAAIDAREPAEREKQRHEIYVGFHELESLLPGAAEATAAPEAEPEHPVLAAALQAAEPPPTRKRPPSQIPAIPSDLARRLGQEGVQFLWGYAEAWETYPDRSEDWNLYPPWMIPHLLAQIAKYHALDDDPDVWRLIEAQEKRIELMQRENELLRQRVIQLESRATPCER